MPAELDPNALVVLELDVDPFGPLSRPEWCTGVFLLPRAKAKILRDHFLQVAEHLTMQPNGCRAAVSIRPLLAVPLDFYDHFIHAFTQDGFTRYVVVQKIEGSYQVIDGNLHNRFRDLHTLEWAALQSLIPSFARIGEARRFARSLDASGQLDWKAKLI